MPESDKTLGEDARAMIASLRKASPVPVVSNNTVKRPETPAMFLSLRKAVVFLMKSLGIYDFKSGKWTGDE